MDRIKKIKEIRTKLKSNQVSIGTWIQIPNSNIAELLSSLNYDWITIDQEHGHISNEKLPDLFRAIEIQKKLPLVRVAETNIENCRNALDAGAGGLILPMVENKEKIEPVINACFWPPSGNRGVGFSRANLYGLEFEKYKKEAQCPIIILQIESLKGVENLTEILTLKKIDAIFIGPYDLSASIGKTGKFNDKQFKDLISEIKSICKKNKIPFGVHVVNPEIRELKSKINEGYKFIAYGIDSVFITKSAKIDLGVVS